MIYTASCLYIPCGIYIFRAVFIISPQYIYSPRGVYYISRGIYKYAWTFLNASGKIILTQMAPHIRLCSTPIRQVGTCTKLCKLITTNSGLPTYTHTTHSTHHTHTPHTHTTHTAHTHAHTHTGCLEFYTYQRT